MLEKILELDRDLFIYLNSLGSEKYDGFWLFITQQINWIPIFLLFAWLVFKKLGTRHAVLILIMIAVLIALTDQTTNHLFKNVFQRLRPGSNPELSNLIRAVQTRKSFSFISGHAANSMAAAMFLFLAMRKHVKYMGFIFLWPLIFAYSRIYLGLHYPLDILCGYIWGMLMALLVRRLYLWAKAKYLPAEN